MRRNFIPADVKVVPACRVGDVARRLGSQVPIGVVTLRVPLRVTISTKVWGLGFPKGSRVPI